CEDGSLLADSPARYGLRLAGGDALRGNELLNYGMGRVGRAFDYDDGDTFEPRLHRFLRMFHEVKPRKNDGKRVIPRAERRGDGEALELHPWVAVVDDPEG